MGSAPLYHRVLGRGPDLLLLHGWGMHQGVWAPLLPRLQHHFRLWLVDLPGHGGSRAHSLSLDQAVTALLATLPAGASWLGWSLGGMVALAAAVAARGTPQAPQRLFLTGSSARFVAEGAWPGMASAQLAQFTAALQQDGAATLDRFLALQCRGADESRATLRLLRQQLAATPLPTSAALAAGLEILATADLRPQLAALTLPIVLLQGERDRIVPQAAAAATAAGLPNGRLVTFERAGHAPFLSHPEAFVEAILHGS